MSHALSGGLCPLSRLWLCLSTSCATAACRVRDDRRSAVGRSDDHGLHGPQHDLQCARQTGARRKVRPARCAWTIKVRCTNSKVSGSAWNIPATPALKPSSGGRSVRPIRRPTRLNAQWSLPKRAVWHPRRRSPCEPSPASPTGTGSSTINSVLSLNSFLRHVMPQPCHSGRHSLLTRLTKKRISTTPPSRRGSTLPNRPTV